MNAAATEALNTVIDRNIVPPGVWTRRQQKTMTHGPGRSRRFSKVKPPGRALTHSVPTNCPQLQVTTVICSDVVLQLRRGVVALPGHRNGFTHQRLAVRYRPRPPILFAA